MLNEEAVDIIDKLIETMSYNDNSEVLANMIKPYKPCDVVVALNKANDLLELEPESVEPDEDDENN
jgi:hypothetical protein